jgi:hypothetical protein
MGGRRRSRDKRSRDIKPRKYLPELEAPKDEKLLDEHIPYEADMLSGTYEKLAGGIEDAIIRNAIIESYCIHCRNLINFLKNDDKNLKVKDFAPTFDYKNVCKEKNYRELISNQVAHLSKKRHSESDEKIGPELWREMYIELSGQLEKFQVALEGDNKKHWPGWEPLKTVPLAPGGANTVIRTSMDAPRGPEPPLLSTTGPLRPPPQSNS